MSKEHEILAKDVGTWDVEILVRPDPQKPAIASKGVARNRLVGGGKWLVMDFQNETGFDGHGLYGYDSARGAYVMTWVDNTRDFLALGEGRYNPETKTMTYVNQATLADGRIMAWREETTTVDDDTRRFRQVFMNPDHEVESMIAIYRRRAAS